MTVRFKADLPDDARSNLVALTTPRVPCGGPYSPQVPHPKQQAFLCLPGREGFFGGSGGGGKSSALLLGALQYVCVPGYSAVLIRRSNPQLEGDDGLVQRSQSWFAPQLASGEIVWRAQRRRYVFPSGARISLGHLYAPDDRLRYQGLAFQYAAFDELTEHPTAKGYLFVGFSRLRRPGVACQHCPAPLSRVSPDHPWKHTGKGCDRPSPVPETIPAACPGCGFTLADVPLRTRSSSNPGGPGHGWVKSRFVARPSTSARFFLPASISDNPSLDADSYRESLQELPLVDRLRIEHGDWNVSEAGRIFDRAWFTGQAGQAA